MTFSIGSVKWLYMVHGKYRPINWDYFLCPKGHDVMVENTQDYTRFMYDTCGSAALATLTGIHPKKIDKQLPKTQKHWSDTSLSNFLKKRHFDVVQLSKRGVTCLETDYDTAMSMPVSKDHILVCNCLVCKNEASWFIVHKNLIWHNFEVSELTPLFFVNKPSQNIWLVRHQKFT